MLKALFCCVMGELHYLVYIIYALSEAVKSVSFQLSSMEIKDSYPRGRVKFGISSYYYDLSIILCHMISC